MMNSRLAVVILFSGLIFAQELPPGTVIPIMLRSNLNASKGKAGDEIEGMVMQAVPLPSGDEIQERSHITGHLVSVKKAGKTGARIVLRFDMIQNSDREIPVTAGLIAVASMASVSSAQYPINDTLDTNHWVTRQVGGDVVNRGRGKVDSAAGVLGSWLQGTSVRIKLTANANAGCPDGPGYEREQAVWIFSSAACGTYDLKSVRIVSPGKGLPLGNIVLTSVRNVALSRGSGWLLISLATD